MRVPKSRPITTFCMMRAFTNALLRVSTVHCRAVTSHASATQRREYL
jgi:hypothetical protein